MTAQPQCSQRGASAWIAHSNESNTWVAPAVVISSDLSYSFPHTSHSAMLSSFRRLRGYFPRFRLANRASPIAVVSRRDGLLTKRHCGHLGEVVRSAVRPVLDLAAAGEAVGDHERVRCVPYCGEQHALAGAHGHVVLLTGLVAEGARETAAA